MKRVFGLMLLVAALVLMTAPGVSAVSQGYVDRVAGYYSGAGGEFTMVPTADWSYVLSTYDPSTKVNIPNDNPDHGVGFQTFCMELSERVSMQRSYYVEISNVAKAGGLNPEQIGGRPDPISVGTAWLYHNFQEKTLSGVLPTGQVWGYDYTVGVGRGLSAAQLQQTIWWLENEVPIANMPNNVFSAAVVAQFGGVAGAMADNNGQIPVGVLNLWTSYNPTRGYFGNAQDMLVCLPVPEPTTLLLLGAGLIGLVTLRRRFTR